jgi:hypothetical protein
MELPMIGMNLKKSIVLTGVALAIAVVPAFSLARTSAPASVPMTTTPEVIVPAEFLPTHKVKTVAATKKLAKKTTATKLAKHKKLKKHKKTGAKKHVA